VDAFSGESAGFWLGEAVCACVEADVVLTFCNASFTHEDRPECGQEVDDRVGPRRLVRLQQGRLPMSSAEPPGRNGLLVASFLSGAGLLPRREISNPLRLGQPGPTPLVLLHHRGSASAHREPRTGPGRHPPCFEYLIRRSSLRRRPATPAPADLLLAAGKAAQPESRRPFRRNHLAFCRNTTPTQRRSPRGKP
jgi:hypothetical protein